jgi:hypothetical protein
LKTQGDAIAADALLGTRLLLRAIYFEHVRARLLFAAAASAGFNHQ